MKLNDFIAQLVQLRESHPEAGDMEVLYRHGASGDCGPLSSARVTQEQTDEGPFDIKPGTNYISIYAGN